MKRLFLIIAILFWCGSLMGQEVGPRVDTLIIKDLAVTKQPKTPKNATFGTMGNLTYQIKKKSSPRRDLKSQIAQLIPIATAMYIWRDELTEFSNKHDKISHGVLAFGLSHYFGPKFAIGFMLSIELTQIDAFRLQGRYKDTAGDLLANAVGIGLAWRF